jgi:phosphoglucosamine mutase
VAVPPGKLFGTDGVRGRTGELLNAELAMAVGRAGTAAVEAERPRVLIIRDTRESGPMLESALAAGVAEAGGEVHLGGVLPTPAALLLSRTYGFDLAAVVSASHNPYHDNGIKLFAGGEGKLDDETEARVEKLIHEPPPPHRHPGRITHLNGAERDYLRALESHFSLDLGGKKVMLDCANGSTYRVAGEIFTRLGADVQLLANQPDGVNINRGCGSTHVESLARQIVGSGADIGFSFDGDGDRVLAVDREGKVHDGDEIIAFIATDRASRSALGGGVVVTVMTNYGFHQAMEAAGIGVEVTSVGDRYVIESLRDRGWVLGGEQSGHIISTDFAPTGDGIAAALMLLEALAGRDLAGSAVMKKLPQTLKNVTVADREAVAGADRVWSAVEEAGRELEGEGRVLVRPSGTEPLVRVMVEAPTQEAAERICSGLVALVEDELGE